MRVERILTMDFQQLVNNNSNPKASNSTSNSNQTSSSNNANNYPTSNHCTCCHICHTSMKTSKREFFHCVSCTSVLCIQCVENYIIDSQECGRDPVALTKQINQIKKKSGSWNCLKCEGKCPCKRCKNRTPPSTSYSSTTLDAISSSSFHTNNNSNIIYDGNYVGKRGSSELNNDNSGNSNPNLPSKYLKTSVSSTLSSMTTISPDFSKTERQNNNGNKSAGRRKKSNNNNNRKVERNNNRAQYDSNSENDNENSTSSEEDHANNSGNSLNNSGNNHNRIELGLDPKEVDQLHDLQSKWEKCEFYRDQITNFLKLIQQQQSYVQQQIEKLSSRPPSTLITSTSSPSLSSPQTNNNNNINISNSNIE